MSKIMLIEVHITPGQGQTTNPLESIFFHKHKASVTLIICCNSFPSNDHVTVFFIHTQFLGNTSYGSGEDFEGLIPYLGVEAILVV